MSSTQQNRLMVTLLPSSQEEVKAYKAAIRLASSVRNKMDAEKAGTDGEKEKVAVNADSDGRHQPNLLPSPPPPADLANHEGREAGPMLNQTSSAHSTSNTTKLGFVRPRDSYPSPSGSMDTGTWPLCEVIVEAAVANLLNLAKSPTGATLEALEQPDSHLPPPKIPVGTGTVLENAAADTPTSVELDALEQHQGHFPPPEPPIGFTPASPEKSTSRPTGPLPIDLNQDPLPYKWNVSGGISPQCQLYVTNTDVNVTFIACPATKSTNDNNDNSTHDLASRQLHSGDASSSHILAIRNTAMCEAPTASFNQRVACGKYDGWFVLGFFVLFCLIVSSWIKVHKNTTQRLDDEENEGAAPSRPSHLSSTTNSSVAKLREKVRKGFKNDHSVEEKRNTEQYEPVAWRSTSYRAARAIVEGKVSHDAGPVAELPRLSM